MNELCMFAKRITCLDVIAVFYALYKGVLRCLMAMCKLRLAPKDALKKFLNLSKLS